MSHDALNNIISKINDKSELILSNEETNRKKKTNSICKSMSHEHQEEEILTNTKCYSVFSSSLSHVSDSQLKSTSDTDAIANSSDKSNDQDFVASDDSASDISTANNFSANNSTAKNSSANNSSADDETKGDVEAYASGNDTNNKSSQDKVSNFKGHVIGANYLNNNKNGFWKKEKKNVMGYNYFTHRQKLINVDDSKILKNTPISVFVGTWNCEYFDFSKNDSYDKKRHTADFIIEDVKEEIYSVKQNDRYSLRSINPQLYAQQMHNFKITDSTSKLEGSRHSSDTHIQYINEKLFEKTQKNFLNDSKRNQRSSTPTSVIPSVCIERNNLSRNYLNNVRSTWNPQKCCTTYETFKCEEDADIHKGKNSIMMGYTKNCCSLLDDSKEKESKKFKNNIKLEIPNRSTGKEEPMSYNVLKQDLDTNNFENYQICLNQKKRVEEYPRMDEKEVGDINDFKKRNHNYSKVKTNYQRLHTSKEKQVFATWIQPYYDIYVICLQESISDNIIDCLSIYLKEINQETYEFLPLTDCKLSGYGDGAFLQMKSTTIAAWVRKSKLHPNGAIKLCASKSIAFNKLNNSKGCVSILFNIFNQYILFIGCHMPAKDREIRQKSREFILTKLSEYFSNKTTTNFKDVFHHVIWMGDFNFRVYGIHLEKAVQCLQNNNLKELLKYDEGHSAYSYDLSISFQELPITFLPTYKKNGNRPVINRNDANWVQKEYKLIHNIKWYKGGRQESRIPSWTDRIFKWSCEKTKQCLIFVPNSYHSPLTQEKSILMASDHSPVSCCFQMYKMKNDHEIPSTKVTLNAFRMEYTPRGMCTREINDL
ncbi:endonuclease/exonuclease/phosphatase domain containing protein [Plasmodium gonderi]|uniref:Endonuclease/exonuclease/phosphatase domain containing protein n=1 Tax=Plasmodium gonderi TaxID=77519 RepID=A0A1Y1JI75_PLAGO|nr:endonuclease/exonuclease/phosphatase domain containing protein [Plasmodium gonderi]GAW80887.1 endonuclease/exonuclease/phosphatase domain containing protein [Plasmodium gonderi]